MQLDFIILSPGGTVADASLAIAGSRAGALGIVDLAATQDSASAKRELHRLLRFGQGRVGILLDGADAPLLEGLLTEAGGRLNVVLLTATDLIGLPDRIQSIHAAGAQAMVQVTSVQEAVAAEAALADALIAKGHEAGGWVGEETTFVLLQRLRGQVELPLWAHGGIGPHTIAACVVAGAVGAVLDSQVLLTRESPLPAATKARLRRVDGSEAVCLGDSSWGQLRVYVQPGLAAIEELRRRELSVRLLEQPLPERRAAWRSMVASLMGWHDLSSVALALGQDAAFGPRLVSAEGTVGDVLATLRSALAEHLSVVGRQPSLGEHSALAQSHGTRYPIVQGPMTRVSDRAAFAESVAEAGALPFLALALMRGQEAASLLTEARERLAGRAWGVGILGFVPPEIRNEQLELIRQVRPPFALIAGGRPDQARTLEEIGIPTYLHVPSPGLLEMFLEDGGRRFVFEGRECGGHVGPRTSFVLWDSMVQILLDKIRTPGFDPTTLHVLFAGGIHDGLSAAMVAATAAPLTERGVRVGVLVGTAYLFTDEIVRDGAIVAGFQTAALEADHTLLLESGPGQATRCLPSPFTQVFDAHKTRMAAEGLTPEEIKDQLEILNVGRLRIAAKGVDRNPAAAGDPQAPRLRELDSSDQYENGLFMIGQAAGLRSERLSLAELHASISDGSTAYLEAIEVPTTTPTAPPPAAVAIVGMGTILPGAPDLATYWRNILDRVDAVREVPPERWDWRRHFDEDPRTRDRIYSRWGGFLEPYPFDPIEYGMPPGSLNSIEPFQLLTLAVVRAALNDAGYNARPFPRERTSVILGAGGGAGDLTSGYVTRSMMPTLFGDDAPDLVNAFSQTLPEWTEDSFAGLLMNVAAGRVANRFDLGGANFTVDAACASSLAAVYNGVRELQTGTSDVVVVGGVDALQNPFIYLCFAKTQALSPSGRCRPFDAQGDGIAISEGFAAVVLKRLEDAERDGDRIYGVIRSVGASSDGKDRGLTAPRPEGQARALQRAYAQAGFSPTTVGLFEAHGTGTVVGDLTEATTLASFLRGAGGSPKQQAAIGSVKSMIGHTKATAGVAGLVKVALSLHHHVLPATLGVSRPNPKVDFESSPLYVNTETRPWIQADDQPRRAGVSAFGFGGTNFHVVVEEYRGSYLPVQRQALDGWPTEFCLWRGNTRADVRDHAQRVLAQLEAGAEPHLVDLAASLAARAKAVDPSGPALAIVSSSLTELQEQLRIALTFIDDPAMDRRHDPRGIHWVAAPLGPEAKVALLFPGQGSQYVNMARDLALLFPTVRAVFEAADRTLGDRLGRSLHRFVFPTPAFSPEAKQAQQAALTDTQVAQPALGVTSLAVLALLRDLGLEADMLAGHSYGEVVALHAAGCFDADVLIELSEARGRFMREGASAEAGTMAAIQASAEDVRAAFAKDPEVSIANLNAPLQTVISGPRAAIERAVEQAKQLGWTAQALPVACAFHSPLVAPAQEKLTSLLAETAIRPPRTAVYSNTTGGAYAPEPEEIRRILGRHLLEPVEFVREINAMYDDGARLFVEVGPKGVLTNLVGRILDDRPHVCATLDQAGRPGLSAFLQGIATLVTEGRNLQLDRLFEGRSARQLDLDHLDRASTKQPLSATTWLVDGGGAHPANRPRVMPQEPLSIRTFEAQGGLATPVTQQTNHTNGHTSTPTEVAPYATLVSTPQSFAEPTAPAAVSPPGRSSEQPRPEVEVIDPGAVFDGAALSDGPTVVMLQFQQVMQRLLQTQSDVMLSYLRGRGAGPGLPAPSTRMMPLSPIERSARPLRAANPMPSVNSAPIVPPPAPAAAHATAPVASAPAPVAAPVQPPVAAPVQARVAVQAPTPVQTPAAAAQPAPPVIEPPATQVPTIDRASITQQLLQIVSDRTGYPTDMLDLDIDLEADLGIDSIKRVEIAGNLLRSVALPRPPDMEKLNGSRTLRQILDRLLADSDAAPAPAAGQGERRPFDSEPIDTTTVGRFVVQVVTTPAPASRAALATGGVVLITDDQTGVAQILQRTLREQGYQVALGDITRLVTVEGVRAWLEEIRQQQGAPVALVHLAPLRPGSETLGLAASAWRPRLAEDLTALFLLSQALGPDLARAAENGGAAVLGATALGGDFGSGGTVHNWPGQGAVGGFLKSLAREQPTVRVKAVDLADSAKPVERARQVAAELLADDRLVEVGYRSSGERVRLETSKAPLPQTEAGPLLAADSVVLITGGARGITAEAALRLAQRYQPTLVLVGRTQEPRAPEPPEVARLETPSAIKAALIAVARKPGQSVTPAAIEAAYRSFVAEREVRRNLSRIRAAGARVEYLSCDVRDGQAFGELIDGVYARYGHLDGVIHGAGVIEDKLVADKTPASFDRVVQTKVEGTLTLLAKLRPEQLRFVALFSSFTARFGNRGQADYGAASEVLNKLALACAAAWPGRVVAMNWGPWLSTGMVSSEVQRQFADRGISLIPIDLGCRMLLQELSAEGNQPAEVVIGGWREPEAQASPPIEAPQRTGASTEDVILDRSLDIEQDLYLLDHRLNGRPVLPMAFAIELMARAATEVNPGLVLAGIEQVRLLKGCVLEEDVRTRSISLRVQLGATRLDRAREMRVSLESPGAKGRLVHYTTTVLLRQPGLSVAEDMTAAPVPVEDARPLPMSLEQAYRDWTFHGPRLRGIVAIRAVGRNGISALLRPTVPADCLARVDAGQWLVDPVVLDSMLQLQLIWGRQVWDVTSLPASVAAYRPTNALLGRSISTAAREARETDREPILRCELRIRPGADASVSRGDYFLYLPGGQLLAVVEDVEVTGSAALNRLVGLGDPTHG